MGENMNSEHRLMKLETKHSDLLRARSEYTVIIDNIHGEDEEDRYMVVGANVPNMTKAQYDIWVKG
jgi:hypothetical protein